MSSSFWSLIFCLLWQSSGGKMLHSPQSGGKEMERILLILLPVKRDPCKYFLTKLWVPVFGAWCFSFSNSSLWEQWGHWKGLLSHLCPHISGSRIKPWCSWKGFPGNKQLRGLVHLNSPLWFSSPHHKIQPEFLCQMLSLWCFLACCRVQGHFSPREHSAKPSSLCQELPHSSPLPLPEHKELCGLEWCTWPKNEGFSLARRFVLWPWEFGLRYPRWSSNPQFQPYWRRCIPRALAKWRIVLGSSLSLSTPTERTWISDFGSVAAIVWTILQWMWSHGSGKCHIPIISKNGASLHSNGKRWTYFSFISPNSPSLSAPSPPPAKFSVEIRQTKIERSGLQIIFFQFCWLVPVTNRLYLGKRKKANSCLTILVSISHLKNITSVEKNRNNNHSLMNTISIPVYRKIGSRQDFTTKKGTLQ